MLVQMFPEDQQFREFRRAGNAALEIPRIDQTIELLSRSCQ
ncbi:MAG: hypothetical protein ACK4QL_01270 [Pseudanabaenaceae cyanobacterium]